MDRHKSIFFEELKKQLSFAELAVEEMLNITHEIMSDEGLKNAERNQTVFWYSAQNLLVSLANISKILYSYKYQKRSSSLRKDLAIPNENVFKDKRMRNSFEHFDERIEELYLSLKRKPSIYIDSNMAEISVANVNMPVVFMRNYLPKELTLTFQGLSLNLDIVQKDLKLLKEKLDIVVQWDQCTQ